MNMIRTIPGRLPVNGVIKLPPRFTSDKSPRWSAWKPLPHPRQVSHYEQRTARRAS